MNEETEEKEEKKETKVKGKEKKTDEEKKKKAKKNKNEKVQENVVSSTSSNGQIDSGNTGVYVFLNNNFLPPPLPLLKIILSLQMLNINNF